MTLKFSKRLNQKIAKTFIIVQMSLSSKNIWKWEMNGTVIDVKTTNWQQNKWKYTLLLKF